MNAAQRCWNHELREAACRCPQCGRFYCRECVTEHEARLLCAGCLRSIRRDAARVRGGWRRMGRAAVGVAGILLAWTLFYSAGRAMILLTGRMEQTEWQDR